MKTLAEPLPSKDIAMELGQLEVLTRFRGLEVYTFFGPDCPTTMLEIGRLRESAFRSVGAGRGGEIDVDDLDYRRCGYHQLVVWDPVAQDLLAMLRFQFGATALELGPELLRTSTLFSYSEHFSKTVLPYAIELGRSIVQRVGRRATISLFALWRGLAELVHRHKLRAFFGNVSIYPRYHETARDNLIFALESLYRPEPWLLRAHPEIVYEPHLEATPDLAGAGETVQERIAFFQGMLGAHGERLPPILQSYLGLGLEISFGETARDDDFGNALEIGIVIPVASIEPATGKRFGL